MELALRLATTLLVLVFFASGGAKVIGLEFEIDAFTRWGYPLWFMYLVGIIEVGGAILLLVPRLTALVAGGLAVFMLGAVATHVVHAEWGMLVVATTILLLAAWRAWAGIRFGRGLHTPHVQV